MKTFYKIIKVVSDYVKSGLLIALISCTTAHAQRAYTLRSPSFTITGDAVIIGNRVMQGASPLVDNGSTSMSYIDIDGSATTTLNSSSANLALPAGSSVVWAGLYWGGRSTNANRNKIKFKKQSQAYVTYTATQLDNGNTITDLAGENHYQAFIDVTSYVATNKSGTYWAGDVQSTTGLDAVTGFYAGWALVVVYTDATQPYHNITVFDGYNAVYTSNVSIPVSGFLTPSSPGFTTKIGTVVWEGDLNQTGDNIRLDVNDAAHNVFNATNPVDDFFNSTVISAPRNPSTTNNWGSDFNYFSSNVALPVNATSTTVHFITAADLYIPGVLVFTVPVNPIVLPVEMISFDAVRVKNSAKLNWVTASEVNCMMFYVERTLDKNIWTTVGSVAGNGTTTAWHQYEFIDMNAAAIFSSNSRSNKTIYYRILEMDFNGATQSSTIKKVSFNDAGDANFTIYPNPATDYAVISLEKSVSDITEMTVTDLTGKIVFSCSYENGFTHTFDVTDLNSGIYFVEIKSNDTSVRKKLIVQ